MSVSPCAGDSCSGTGLFYPDFGLCREQDFGGKGSNLCAFGWGEPIRPSGFRGAPRPAMCNGLCSQNHSPPSFHYLFLFQQAAGAWDATLTLLHLLLAGPAGRRPKLLENRNPNVSCVSEQHFSPGRSLQLLSQYCSRRGTGQGRVWCKTRAGQTLVEGSTSPTQKGIRMDLWPGKTLPKPCLVLKNCPGITAHWGKP